MTVRTNAVNGAARPNMPETKQFRTYSKIRANDKTVQQCDVELGKLYKNKSLLRTSLNYILDNTGEAKTSEYHTFVQIW